MEQRIVIVNGVQIPMYRENDEPGIRPMKIAIGLLRKHPSESFGGAPKDEALLAIDALQEAGVKWLPLIEEEAKTAGIGWDEQE